MNLWVCLSEYFKHDKRRAKGQSLFNETFTAAAEIWQRLEEQSGTIDLRLPRRTIRALAALIRLIHALVKRATKHQVLVLLLLLLVSGVGSWWRER